MAKTLDTLVTETLGAQLRMILELQAQNEALRDTVAEQTRLLDAQAKNADALSEQAGALGTIAKDALHIAERAS